VVRETLAPHGLTAAHTAGAKRSLGFLLSCGTHQVREYGSRQGAKGQEADLVGFHGRSNKNGALLSSSMIADSRSHMTTATPCSRDACRRHTRSNTNTFALQSLQPACRRSPSEGPFASPARPHISKVSQTLSSLYPPPLPPPLVVVVVVVVL
jgi:hypothetical protein